MTLMQWSENEMDWSSLHALRDYINKQIGFHFDDAALPTLAIKCRLLLGASIPDLGTLVERLRAGDRSLISQLISCVTVGETWFYRFEAQWRALEGIVRAWRTGLKYVLWAAGCSTGEEAYSLAILLKTAAPHISPDQITIIASEIDREALHRGRQGRYLTRTSCRRSLPIPWTPYLQRDENGDCTVHPEIRKMVTFVEHNLVADHFPEKISPHGVDIVFCRNVLIYFDQENRKKVLGKFADVLRANGWLFLGESETTSGHPRFIAHAKDGCYIHQLCDANTHCLPLPKTQALRTPETPLPVRKPTFKQSIAKLRRSSHLPAQPSPVKPRYSRVDKLPTAEAMLDLSIEKESLGEVEEAIICLRKALFLDRSFILAHYFLASLHERTGKISDATRSYRNVVRLLESLQDDSIVPGSGGLSVAFLRESINAKLKKTDLIRKEVTW